MYFEPLAIETIAIRAYKRGRTARNRGVPEQCHMAYDILHSYDLPVPVAGRTGFCAIWDSASLSSRNFKFADVI